MEYSPSGEANSSSDSQEIPCVLRNPRFITVVTRSHHLSLSWARSI